MGASAGRIDLDLNLNQGNFNRQLSGIAGVAKKAGAMLAGAFAVKKLVDFGASCLKLGSDLQEVQNVVDVTFPNMSKQVNDFAKNAAASFGLSETMAKKFTGTFGAMGKAFGFSEKEAYDMATTLTGLSGDVASFYNISQDEAYTKLKSVFTGETETLKDLGIVMTQNALDAYAMANGYGKTTQKMSEAEKVALRYKFVQEQLTLASGDFIRTSDGWANQMRILNLQFDSFKATIGQGLINLFTPVIKSVNLLMLKLVKLADIFKSFTELITGKKSDPGGGVADTANAAGVAEEGLGSAAGAADNLGKATDAAGKKAKKAAKDMKQLSGMDSKLNVLSDSKSDSDSGGGSGGGSGAGAGAQSTTPETDLGNLAQGETIIDKLLKKLQPLIDRCKELASLFAKGFVMGFGDSLERIATINESIKSIGKSLWNIFTDKGVVDAANAYMDSVAENMGKAVGSFVSVGVTIADNILGGVSKYLTDNTDYIKQRIIGIFKVSTDILDLFGDFAVSFADIFTVFSGEDGKSITASIIGIFSNAILGIVEVLDRDIRNVLKAIIEPIIENKDKIKTALENTLKPIAKIADSVKELVTNSFKKIIEVYDTYIDPAWERFKNGISTVFSMALDAYNDYLAPVLDWIADRFTKLINQYIQPLIDSFLELWGKAVEAVSMFWEFISPFVGWFVQKFIAVIATKLQWLWTKAEAVVSLISTLFKGLFDVLSGLIDFVVGVFTADWDKAWNGIKKVFSAIWETIKGIVQVAIDFVANIIETGMTAIKNGLDIAWNGIKLVFSTAWGAIKKVFLPIGKWFKDRWTDIVEAFKSAGSWFKTQFTTAYKGVTDAFKNIGAWFKNRWTDITGAFSKVTTWFSEKFEIAWTNIKTAFSIKTIEKYFGDIWTNIKSCFSGITGWFSKEFTKAWTAVKNVFSSGGKIFDGIKDGILSGLKSVINGLIDGINKIISVPFSGLNSALNKVKSVSIMGAKPFSGLPTIDTPKIPRLAQGGFVKANTPQLAMIGDNRHQGEVVAPEDKLRKMALEAVNMAQGNGTGSATMEVLLRQILYTLEKINSKDTVVSLAGKDIFNTVRQEANSYKKRTGKPAFI